MIRTAMTAAAAMLLASCTSYDQRMATNFMPLEDGKWRYQTFADAVQPLERASAEAYRMEMLEIWLGENNLCPAGYTIISKQPVKRSSGGLGDIYDVYYEGACA